MTSRSATVRESYRLVRRRLRLIFLASLVVIIGTYATLGVLPEVYESETSLLIGLGSENTPKVVQDESWRHELNSEVQVLRSRHLVEQVVDALGVEAFQFRPHVPSRFVDLPRYYVQRLLHGTAWMSGSMLEWLNLKPELTPREAAILMLDRSLEVEKVSTSNVINARLRLPDAALSAEALDRLIQEYLETRVEIRRSSRANDFLGERVFEVQRELAAIEEKEALLAEPALGDLETQGNLLTQRLNETESVIDTRRSERAMLVEERAEMERRLDALPDEIQRSELRVRNPARAEIEARITELKLTREQLLGRYLLDSVPVKNVDDEIAGLATLLTHEDDTRFDSVTTESHPVRREFAERIQTLSVRIAGLTASTAELEQIASELTSDLEQLNTRQEELELLARQRQQTEQRYLAYSQRIHNAEISAELNGLRAASVTLLRPPAVPLEASSPRKSLVMLISIPIALLVGLTLAGLAEWTDDRVRCEKDVVALEGIDYLGVFELSPASIGRESTREP